MYNEFKCADQSPEQYKLRVYKNREQYGLSWKDISDLLGSQIGYNKSPQACRSEYKRFRFKYTNQNDPIQKIQTQDIDYGELTQDIQKYKLRQILNQNNAYIRRLSREQTIKQIARDFAKQMSSKKILTLNNDNFVVPTSGKEAILCLSDWHYGIQCNNYWNKYDTDIAKVRIANLQNNVINLIKQKKIKTLYVLNLGDLICGRIHLTLRLQSRIDTITQIMEISQILAQMLNDLSNFTNIKYYSCSDNHSRIQPNKTNSIDLESLTRITDWYLQQRLQFNDKIHIGYNCYDSDIIQFTSENGFRVGAVHGNKDNMTNIASNIRAMTGHDYQIVCTAHHHHFQVSEQNETLVIANGSLMGVDTYAKNLRKTSKPSQNMIILQSGYGVQSIYPIQV